LSAAKSEILAGEAEHVGLQPVLQQSRFLDLLGGAMRGGLIDDACQGAKLLGAGVTAASYNEYAIWVSPRTHGN
jgi:hypothetical protein